MLHEVPAIAALPEAPEVALHVTDTVEVPPVTEPESATVVDVVLVGTALIVSVSGVAVLESCAAYRVHAAALSPGERPITIR